MEAQLHNIKGLFGDQKLNVDQFKEGKNWFYIDSVVLEKSGVFKGVDESDPQNWGKTRYLAYFQ